MWTLRQAAAHAIALSLLALAACECTVGEPPSSTAETAATERDPGSTGSRRPAPTGPVAAPEEGCAAGRPAIIETSGARVPTVAVAISGERGLVIHPEGADSLKAWPTDPSGAPLGEPSVLSLPHARRLMAFEAVGPRFVAVSLGACPQGIDGRRCSFARAMNADGTALGDPVVAGHGVPRTLRVRATSEALYVARSTEDGGVQLDRFRFDGTGLSQERIELGDEGGLEGEHVEVLGLAATERRWAVVWRAGATEDAASEVWVTTPDGQREAEPLHHALLIEQMRFSDDSIEAIAAFEFSRPKLVRMSADGEMASEEIPADQAVPEPFADALTAGVTFADGTLQLVVRNGAGDRLERVELLNSSDPSVPHVGDVTRSGNGFLVAFTGPEANGFAVGTTRVQCAPGWHDALRHDMTRRSDDAHD